MASVGPFGAYQVFMAVKNHFRSEKYDYFKYNGKVRTNRDSFERRSDFYRFESLSRKFNKADLELLVAITCYEKDKAWIGDLFTETSINRMKELKRDMMSFEYVFENDVKKILRKYNTGESLKKFLYPNEEGTLPEVIRWYGSGEISLITLLHLNSILNVFDRISEYNLESPIWQEKSFKFAKITGFLNINSSSAKTIFVKNFKKLCT